MRSETELIEFAGWLAGLLAHLLGMLTIESELFSSLGLFSTYIHYLDFVWTGFSPRLITLYNYLTFLVVSPGMPAFIHSFGSDQDSMVNSYHGQDTLLKLTLVPVSRNSPCLISSSDYQNVLHLLFL